MLRACARARVHKENDLLYTTHKICDDNFFLFCDRQSVRFRTHIRAQREESLAT